MRITQSRLLTLAVLVMLLSSLWAMPARADSDRIVFADDFTNNEAGWKPTTVSDTQLDVNNGALNFGISIAGQANWAMPAATIPDDIDFEIRADPVNPNPNGSWNLGILLRADRRDTQGSFYHFGLNGTGNWEFRVRPKNAKSYTNALNSGQIANFNANRGFKLKISARGNRFTFIINDAEVGTFEDSSLASDAPVEHYFGLMVGTYENASENTVKFTNLTITEPVSTAVARGKALMQETFADNTNKWNTSKQTNSDAFLEKNGLIVQVNRTNIMRWVFPDPTFPKDLDISVDAKNTNPDSTGGWAYGIGFRTLTQSSEMLFYLFEVRGTGQYTVTIQHVADTVSTDKVVIEPTNIKDFSSSKKYTLRVIAKGSELSFYLNGELLKTVTDNGLQAPDKSTILLVTSTFLGSPSARVRFENFTVAELPQ